MCSPRYLLILIIGVTLTLPYLGSSEKILSLAFVATRSHKITYEPLLRELASRGHEVTVVSPIPATKKVKNLREIFTFDADAQFAKLPDLFKSKEAGEEPNPFQMVDMFKTFCEQSYDLPEVMALLDEKFDLVMVESVFNECAFGLIHKLNTSLVIVSPLVVPSWTSAALGGFSPPSFVPNIFSGFTDRMTFYQRLLNFASEVLVKVLRKFYFNPAMAEIYRNKLNDSTIPLPDEILKNASLVISNSHLR